MTDKIEKKEEEKEVVQAIFPNTYKVCIKIFGIPLFTKERTIDEDALYERMSDRFYDELNKLSKKGK